jgi:KDO2-lipid IV(A) lauroyltransferase
MFVVAYYILGYRKKIVAENLLHAFPEKTQGERLAIEKAFYRNFTDSLAETIKLLTISRKELTKRFVIENPEMVLKRLDNGETVIGLSAHLFNWEGHQLAISRFTQQRSETVYLKVNNPFFDKLMKKIRGRMGGDLTERYGFQRNYLKNRDKNRLIVLAADQRPNQSEIRHGAKFMNRETAFFEGAERLAKKFGHAVVYGQVRKPKRGHYVFRYVLISEPPYAGTPAHSITHQFIKYTEENIRQEPSIYLWSHNRWKKT